MADGGSLLTAQPNGPVPCEPDAWTSAVPRVPAGTFQTTREPRGRSNLRRRYPYKPGDSASVGPLTANSQSATDARRLIPPQDDPRMSRPRPTPCPNPTCSNDAANSSPPSAASAGRPTNPLGFLQSLLMISIMPGRPAAPLPPRQPLYSHARRRGLDHEDAQDLVQGFFARLIDKTALRQTTPERGRFRSFLLASFGHFLANDHDHRHALKRGGGVEFVPLPETDQELPAEGKSSQYRLLRPFLFRSPDPGGYDQAATALGLRASQMPKRVFRFRQRLRALVREEMAWTVCTPPELEAEWRHLVDLIADGEPNDPR